MIRRWRQLAGDERGTSLTEFAITLPIFVAVMSFVYYIGAAGHVITDEATKTQRMVWDDVIPHTQPGYVPVDHGDPDQPHVHPSTGAEVDRQFLQDEVIRQPRGDLKAEIRAHEVQTSQAMGSDGHWGASFRRTRPVDSQATMARGADQMTNQPTDVVGGSDYARRLVDDTSAATPITMGSGGPDALQPAATSSSGSGLAPVLGAGMRYGVSNAIRHGEVELPREWAFDVKFHYSTLVPPAPVRDDARVSGITRTQMERDEPYQKLLGIQMDPAETLPDVPAPSSPAWPDD